MGHHLTSRMFKYKLYCLLRGGEDSTITVRTWVTHKSEKKKITVAQNWTSHGAAWQMSSSRCQKWDRAALARGCALYSWKALYLYSPGSVSPVTFPTELCWGSTLEFILLLAVSHYAGRFYHTGLFPLIPTQAGFIIQATSLLPGLCLVYLDYLR